MDTQDQHGRARVPHPGDAPPTARPPPQAPQSCLAYRRRRLRPHRRPRHAAQSGARSRRGQGRRRQEGPHRRRRPERRLAEPVPRPAAGQHQHPPADVRVPDELRRQEQQGDPRLRHRVEALRRQADLDVHHPRRLEVVGRQAGHRRGRRVDLQQDDDRRGRRHLERQLRHQLQEGDRAQPHQAGHRAEGAAGHDGRARRADRAQARLGEGRRLLEVQQRQDARSSATGRSS